MTGWWLAIGLALAQDPPVVPPADDVVPEPVLDAPPADAPPEAPPDAASDRIVRVEVEGTRRLEPFVVLAAVDLSRGDRATRTAIRRDLKAVYATGFFDDVQVETRPEADGVVLVFVVSEKPAIREVNLAGQKRIDEEDLNEVLDIRPFTVLNDAAVQRNVEALRAKYVEKGYFLAEIEPVITWISTDQVDLTFQIVEGRKVVVQRIDFSGNQNLDATRIRRYMKTKQGGAVPWLTSRGAYQSTTLETDLDTIRFLYWEEGYWDVQVSQPNVYLSPDKRSIFVSIAIEEGPRYHVGEVVVDGDFVPEEGLSREAVLGLVAGRSIADVQEEQWRAATGRRSRQDRDPTGPALVTGEPFKYTTYAGVVENVRAFYEDQGYAFAEVQPNRATRPDEAIVDLSLTVVRGERMRIGRIDISGNDPTFDKVIRRELELTEGQIYRGSLRRASELRIQRLGYFEEATIEPTRSAEPGILDLRVRVSEKPTGSVQAGAGVQGQAGVTLNAAMSKENFLGLGYSAAFSINWSKLQKLYNVSFQDPYFLDSRWSLSFNVYNQNQNFQQFQVASIGQYNRGLSVGIGRYLDARDDARLTLDYTVDKAGLSFITPTQGRLLGGELFRNGLTSTLTASLLVDKRNNRLRPTDGWFLSASTALSGGFRIDKDHVLTVLGGDFRFAETSLNARFYKPLDEKQIFVLRGQSILSRTWSLDGRAIPFVHRYRVGGIMSLRGFRPWSLGPSLRGVRSDDPSIGDSNLVVGGTERWVNNFEIEAHILRSAGLSVVAFFDAGNAFGDPWDRGHINPLQLRTSVGGGVRWQSPMGPLRFEYGINLNPREGEKRGLMDFGIGGFF